MARRIEADNPRHSTPTGDVVGVRVPAAPEIAGAPCVPDPPTAYARRRRAESALTHPSYSKGRLTHAMPPTRAERPRRASDMPVV